MGSPHPKKPRPPPPPKKKNNTLNTYPFPKNSDPPRILPGLELTSPPNGKSLIEPYPDDVLEHALAMESG